MLVAVPFEVGGGVVEPIIGAEVDHLRARGQHSGNDLGAGAVWKAAEHALGPAAHLLGREILQQQVDPAHQAGVHTRDGRVALLPAGGGDDLDLRVPEQDLQRFECRVASGAEDRDFDHGQET